MKMDDDEKFVQLCCGKFDEINNMATIRGTPGSKNVRSKQKNTQLAWENITSTMNNLMKVSVAEKIFYIDSHIWFHFLSHKN